MGAIPFSETSLSSLKKALRKDLPHVRSSHISEAMAAAMGFRTYASLLSKLPEHAGDPPFVALDDDRLDHRLQELGYPPDREFSFELLDDCEDLISTGIIYTTDYQYRTGREKAWRNLMVLAINEGLRQKLFSLRPYDNRWPGADPESMGHRGTDCIFDFTLPNGLPAKGYVSDAGHAELSIHAAVKPKDDWIKASNAGFSAGDAFATGWLERQNGAWLMFSPDQFNCRKALLDSLVQLTVEPMGFGDKGKVIT